MLKHLCIEVNSDEKQEIKFDGSLADLGAIRINEELDKISSDYRIISINHQFGSQEMRPVMCNSATWYTQYYAIFHVWYEDFSSNSKK